MQRKIMVDYEEHLNDNFMFSFTRLFGRLTFSYVQNFPKFPLNSFQENCYSRKWLSWVQQVLYAITLRALKICLGTSEILLQNEKPPLLLVFQVRWVKLKCVAYITVAYVGRTFLSSVSSIVSRHCAFMNNIKIKYLPVHFN